jgi:ribosomal protein S27E
MVKTDIRSVGVLTFGHPSTEKGITDLARFFPVPALISHYILRVITCPGCGHAQVIKFKFNMLEIVEQCEACGRVVRFERPMPGSEAWKADRDR